MNTLPRDIESAIVLSLPRLHILATCKHFLQTYGSALWAKFNRINYHIFRASSFSSVYPNLASQITFDKGSNQLAYLQPTTSCDKRPNYFQFTRVCANSTTAFFFHKHYSHCLTYNADVGIGALYLPSPPHFHGRGFFRPVVYANDEFLSVVHVNIDDQLLRAAIFDLKKREWVVTREFHVHTVFTQLVIVGTSATTIDMVGFLHHVTLMRVTFGAPHVLEIRHQVNEFEFTGNILVHAKNYFLDQLSLYFLEDNVWHHVATLDSFYSRMYVIGGDFLFLYNCSGFKVYRIINKYRIEPHCRIRRNLEGHCIALRHSLVVVGNSTIWSWHFYPLHKCAVKRDLLFGIKKYTATITTSPEGTIISLNGNAFATSPNYVHAIRDVRIKRKRDEIEVTFSPKGKFLMQRVPVHTHQ